MQEQRNYRIYPVPDPFFSCSMPFCFSRVQRPRRGHAAPGANPEPAVRRQRSGGHDQPV